MALTKVYVEYFEIIFFPVNPHLSQNCFKTVGCEPLVYSEWCNKLLRNGTITSNTY